MSGEITKISSDMTQVSGDLTVNQNIMFAGKIEVTQALSFFWVYDIFLQISNSQIIDFRFVSQITVSDFNSLKFTSYKNKR